MGATEDMSFEEKEIERGFDFANVSFGAFLSAYLGLQLVHISPDLWIMIKIASLLAVITLIGHSLRMIAVIFVHGLQTFRHTLTTSVTFVAGVAAYVSICLELAFPMSVMASLGIGWLLTCLFISILMILRRWIKVYD